MFFLVNNYLSKIRDRVVLAYIFKYGIEEDGICLSVRNAIDGAGNYQNKKTWLEKLLKIMWIKSRKRVRVRSYGKTVYFFLKSTPLKYRSV